MAERRNRQHVDPFQTSIFIRIVAYAFIYQLTVWNLMFGWRLLQSGESVTVGYRQFFYENYPMLLCVLLLAPAFAWDAVKYCHRVAGPIYRFRWVMRQITAGEPVRRVKLRQGDQLLGMQDDFNDMLDAVAARGGVTLIDASAKPPEASPSTLPMFDAPRQVSGQ